jgi:uncharacterized protein
MYRILTENLIAWKSKEKRKPLVIQGARQVGKTWLMKSFGAENFETVVYINFETNANLQKVFREDFNIARILQIFEIATGKKITTNTLIILDEIQEAEKGLTALKYFYEEAAHIYVMAAGSYLGVQLQKNTSFPIGKVDLLQLNPMTFEEFLLNINEQNLATQLKNNNWEVIAPFHEKLTNYLRQYYFVGGMPEAALAFIEYNNLINVREIQKSIITGYENDFAKHAPIEIVPKIKMVWQSIISQLAKENKKFIYGQLKKGARAKEFETAIHWLVNAGLLHKVNKTNKIGLPLSSYLDFDSFKLFCMDTGLLNAMANVSEAVLLQQNKIITEFKGAITEQYVCQQLTATYQLFYWSEATAEIDFIIEKNNEAVPIEVKAEQNLKAKSLKVYASKYEPKIAWRTSLAFYKKETWLENIPLYAIGFLK